MRGAESPCNLARRLRADVVSAQAQLSDGGGTEVQSGGSALRRLAQRRHEASEACAARRRSRVALRVHTTGQGDQIYKRRKAPVC